MEKKRITEIREARRRGNLPRFFSRADLRAECPGWPEGTYRAFLSKHCEGYAAKHGNTVLFARVKQGVYMLIEEAADRQDRACNAWPYVAAALEEVLPVIDEALGKANIPLSERVQKAFELVRATMLEVSDYRAFLLSDAYGRFLVILTDWYRQRYGDAVADDAAGFVAAVLVHGTPFVMRVPRYFSTIDDDPSCMWVGFPAVVQAEENPLDWIQQQGVVSGLSRGEVEDVRRTALATANLVRSIGFDVWMLESEASSTIGELARSVRADLQDCARSLCGRDDGSLRSAAWHASQATEKVLKVFVEKNGTKPPRTHNLFELSDQAEKLGARPIDRARLALVPSGTKASAIRYGGTIDLSSAMKAYGAALAIVEQVVFDAKPNKKIDVRRARFKMKRAPWFDFNTEAFREALRSGRRAGLQGGRADSRTRASAEATSPCGSAR